MEIVEFLTARLDEDEAAALAWPEDQREWQYVGRRNLIYDNGRHESVAAIDVSNRPIDFWERIRVLRASASLAEHIIRWDPARVLREIEAKRRLIRAYVAATELTNSKIPPVRQAAKNQASALTFALRLAAMAYADHPDYDTAWRVE